MSKSTSLICEHCGKKTLHTQASLNHILHLILSIVTGGVWLVVWIFLALVSDSAWRCSECGKAAPGAGWGLAGSVFRGYKQSELEEKIKKSEKQCPFCAETIKTEATLCRYCGNDVAETSKPHLGFIL